MGLLFGYLVGLLVAGGAIALGIMAHDRAQERRLQAHGPAEEQARTT